MGLNSVIAFLIFIIVYYSTGKSRCASLRSYEVKAFSSVVLKAFSAFTNAILDSFGGA